MFWPISWLYEKKIYHQIWCGSRSRRKKWMVNMLGAWKHGFLSWCGPLFAHMCHSFASTLSTHRICNSSELAEIMWRTQQKKGKNVGYCSNFKAQKQILLTCCSLFDHLSFTDRDSFFFALLSVQSCRHLFTFAFFLLCLVIKKWYYECGILLIWW